MAIDPFDGDSLLSGDGVGAGDADQQLVVFGLEQLLSGPAFFRYHRRGRLGGPACKIFNLVQVVQKRGDLFQVQMLRIAEGPGAQLTPELGIGGQAVFEYFTALTDAGAHLG
ncbi:hypothetical protein D3C87_1424150 [compost metagenome]